MYMVKDMYIKLDDIRKMHFDVDQVACYIVIVYDFDEDHPTKIAVRDRDEYFDIAHEICMAIRERERR